VVPEGKDTIVTDHYGPPGEKTVLPCATRLYVEYQLGGPTAIRAFTLSGKPAPAPKQPEIATVGGMTLFGGDDILFSAGSFVEPVNESLNGADKGGETGKPPLSSPPVVEFGDITVVREFATSKDGTKVPVNILIPKGAKLDGSNPCVVTGYGGYSLSRTPTINQASRVA